MRKKFLRYAKRWYMAWNKAKCVLFYQVTLTKIKMAVHLMNGHLIRLFKCIIIIFYPADIDFRIKPSIAIAGIKVRRPILTHDSASFFIFLKTVDFDILRRLPASCIVMKYGSNDDRLFSIIPNLLIY
jgi:hypothetical protein